jgi:Bacterial virulence factor lipase N-terminal
VKTIRSIVLACAWSAATAVWANSDNNSDASKVRVRADAASINTTIFPSNRFTVFDGSQATLRRVNLPKPDCAVRPSDCADIDVLNQLDGFSTQPRITVPFTGDIDPSTVNSDTVYLVNLGDTLTARGFGQRVGINQAVWDVATKTLAVQSDELLQPRSRYLLVVTDGVRDASGKKIKGSAVAQYGGYSYHDRGDHEGRDYEHQLRSAGQAHRAARHKVVAASLFTTQSIASDLAKINRQIKASQPQPVNFMIGDAGSQRAVFDVAGLQAIQHQRQTGAAPAFTASFLPTPALQVVPGAVAQVAYGQFSSPDYQTAAKVIPAVGTLTGQPQVQGSNRLLVQVFVPAGPKPAGGWPVALFGHGFGDSMYGAPWTVASVFASQGLATVSINVVGHGGGTQGSLNVLRPGAAPVVVPSGGRGIDQDGNGAIDSTEGVNAVAPQNLIASRDGLRQTVVDYMQLVRQIEAGVDVDGDGNADLDAQRIHYAGQSFGGIYGSILMGTEPNIKTGVLNVPGGSITEIARQSPVFRTLVAINLVIRTPNLINLPPLAGVPFPANLVFNENLPLRDEPVRLNTVPGATAIAEYVDRSQWVSQSGNPVSYAPLIRQQPLRGHAPKPVIVQFAKGDLTVPNPTTSAIVRAGGLADRTVYYRHDLAYATTPALGKNPHAFLTGISNPAAAPLAVGAQQMIAIFFASGGMTVIDPDGTGPLFEVPIAGPLPQGTNFIP